MASEASEKRRFDVHFEGDVMLRVDQAVIDRTQEGSWRKQFFRFTPREAAEHIAFNLVVNGSTLSGIDGFADMDDSLASVDRLPDWDITTEEEG